ncbi:MAG: hypothetical protein Q4Q02_01555 [Clostridium sp.]|nr:hypothetical protein [Clostridium sp.]
MNTVTAKRYQDLMQEFLKTPRSDAKGFRKKYEEVLNEFLNLDEVYVIASRSATVQEVKENKARPLCALNHKKLPCMWFFSEREFAQNFVKHFGIIKDGVEYIRKLQGEELIKVIKFGIFNGVYQFSIDEGKCTMFMVPYDLLNTYLVNKGEENFLEKSQYELMILFTMMKFHKKLVYAIESDDKDNNGKNILAADRSGVLNIFANKDDANIHKYDIGYGRKEAIELNIVEFRNAINSIVDSIETVRFEVKENIIEIKSSKLVYILNEMVKVEYK